jgi:protein-S-isoprenylcysteine O-methyltransferase Ste14
MSDENASPLRHDWPAWAPAAQAVGLFLFHGALPFGLSMLSYRHGWPAGHPSAWNALGLLPVAAGIALIVWIIALHRREAVRHGWRFEKTPFEPQRYLIVTGPYGYTRNPIYLSHLTIWSGWTVFYGSVAVAAGVVVLWLALAFVIVPYEESGLIRQVGEPYLRYQHHVHRWFGKRRVAPL